MRETILAAVYGNRAFEDTLLELEDTLVLAGFDCKAAVAAVAEHSIMHQFGQGRPDAEDEKRLPFCCPDKSVGEGIRRGRRGGRRFAGGTDGRIPGLLETGRKRSMAAS